MFVMLFFEKYSERHKKQNDRFKQLKDHLI